VDFNFEREGITYHCNYDNKVSVVTPRNSGVQLEVDRVIEAEIDTEYFVNEEFETYTLSELLQGDFPKPNKVPFVKGRVY